LKYFTTLVAVPAIEISFYLRISCLFPSLSIVKTIEPNLVYRLCLFILDKIYLGSPYILIGLKVLISSFRSLEPPCYGPNNSSSYTTGKRYKQTSGRSTGGARTSRTMGRGVAKSHNVTRLVRNVGT
jgi:hypothetical protein